ncbi:tumor necrosis factor receptor superfamily member 3-like [Ptychodera flava]|uniref:tumor necrosis factor receptor superfamily member 3-like n=1 Tax=Ptychodera flava TaxID=63121 RepID=UPI00396AA587
MTVSHPVCLFLLVVAVVCIEPIACRRTGDGEGERRTFKHEDRLTGERRRCLKCPPGTYLQKPCAKSRDDTVCAPCPQGSFTSEWNHLESCIACKQCGDNSLGFEGVMDACTANGDAVCACKDGYFWHDHRCQPHKSCPPGRGVVVLGSSTHNTVCEKCPAGTFSDVESSSQPCNNQTNCAVLGLDTLEPGSRYQDNICSQPVVKTTTLAMTTREGPGKSTKKGTLKPLIQKLGTTRHSKTHVPTAKPTSEHHHPPHHHAGPVVHHHPDFKEDFLQDERDEYFDPEVELEMEMEEMEMEMEESYRQHGARKSDHEYERVPAHGVKETHFNVEELAEESTHTTDNGSGLAAGILGAGCLFLLVLIAVLYQRKKRVEEQQKLKKLQEQPPKWQKLDQPHASEENLALLKKNRGKESPASPESATSTC